MNVHREGSKVVYEGEFDTVREATDWIVGLERSYHPAGYGTTCSLELLDDGRAKVSAYRWQSCD